MKCDTEDRPTKLLFSYLPGKLDKSRKGEMIEAFNVAYQELYGDVRVKPRPIEITNWRLTVSGPAPTVQIEVSPSACRKVGDKG